MAPKSVNGGYGGGGGRDCHSSGEEDSTDDDVLKELQVPVQFRQMSDMQSSQQLCNKRKDLSKFLGLDDSDSEEIVFIQNTKPPSAKQNPVQQQHHPPNGNSSYSSFESCLLPPPPGGQAGAVPFTDQESTSGVEESILSADNHMVRKITFLNFDMVLHCSEFVQIKKSSLFTSTGW